MYVSIGRRAQSEHLVDLLRECHERIRTFSRLAVALGERDDVPSAEVIEASQRCERYFAEALPLHVQDEEQSVLPRLKGQRREIDNALASMHEQHAEHAPQVTALLEALRAIRSDPTGERPRAALRSIAERLARELEEHLQAEEKLIFPAISTLLPQDVQRLAVQELRARRK